MARGLAFEARGSQRQEAGQEVLEPRTGVWGGGGASPGSDCISPIAFSPPSLPSLSLPWVEEVGQDCWVEGWGSEGTERREVCFLPCKWSSRRLICHGSHPVFLNRPPLQD